MTVAQARTPYSRDDVSTLGDAYVKVFMPDEKSTGGSDHERAVRAVREGLRRIEEQKKQAVEAASSEGAQPAPTH